MPPRTGQLDQISESIGEIRAYVHAGRHDIANLTGIINGLDAAQIKRHNDLKTEVGQRIDRGMETMRSEIAIIAARVAILEEFKTRQSTGTHIWKWIIATLIAFGTVVAGFWQHK